MSGGRILLQLNRGLNRLLGGRGIAAFQESFAQKVVRAVLLRFLLDGVGEDVDRFGGALSANQENAEIEFRLVELGLELECLLILFDRLRVLLLEAVRER